MANICSTIFFNADPAEIRTHYEAIADPANGYLTRLHDNCVILVDATASETADWSRQTQLAALLSANEVIAISVFVVGELWALALAFDGKAGPIAAFTPDNPKIMEELPYKLLAIEQQLDDIVPDRVDTEQLDRLFGSMLERYITPEEGITELFDQLGCLPDWPRWSWYETIPEQLFLDPDLANRVIPLGET
ncbi:MAG TPA: hypothetical protein VHV83_15540, partial [Armatimonadota bacterium]|nr:hypothetical protein [Armatimonadota bacterium]